MLSISWRQSFFVTCYRLMTKKEGLIYLSTPEPAKRKCLNLIFSTDRIGADIFIPDLIALISLSSTVDDIINA